MTSKVLTEEEMFDERLRRLDKQEYLDEKEHRFILANIKACFKEALHQREYIKQLESELTKQHEILEILKGHYYILDINKSLNTIELSFKLEDKKFNLIKEFFRQ